MVLNIVAPYWGAALARDQKLAVTRSHGVNGLVWASVEAVQVLAMLELIGALGLLEHLVAWTAGGAIGLVLYFLEPLSRTFA